MQETDNEIKYKKSILKLSKEEKSILWICQTKWTNLLYELPQATLLTILYGPEILVTYTAVNIIAKTIDSLNGRLFQGMMFNKDKEFKGFRLITFINLILLTLAIMSPIQLNYKLGAIYGVSLLISTFNSNYIAIKHEIKYGQLNILYVPYILIIYFITYYLNPFGDIIKSIFIIFTVADLLFSVISILYTDPRKYYKELTSKFSIIEELKAIKGSIIREANSLISISIENVIDFLFVKAVAVTMDSYGMVLVILRQMNGVSIMQSIVTQYKRLLLTPEEINFKRLLRIHYFIITFESSIIIAIYLYINRVLIGPITAPLLLYILSYHVTMYLTLISGVMVMPVKKESDIKTLVAQTVTYSVLISIFKIVIPMSSMYYVSRFTAILCKLFVVNKAYKKHDNYNTPKNLAINLNVLLPTSPHLRHNTSKQIDII